MSLPSQFMLKNYDDILIYHYVEELVSDFSQFSAENYTDEIVSVNEIPFCLESDLKTKAHKKIL